MKDKNRNFLVTFSHIPKKVINECRETISNVKEVGKLL